MLTKLILASGMVVALAAPALAEWNVVKEDGTPVCLVVERAAKEKGETRIAGPFQTEAEAQSAQQQAPECQPGN